MSGLFATSETDAREQAAALPHTCGETDFPSRATVTGSHVENLRLMLLGTCPRCGAARSLSFKLPVAPAVVRPAPTEVPEGIREARELYGAVVMKTCPSCDGKGESYGVLGDYTAGWSDCTRCGGSGKVVADD